MIDCVCGVECVVVVFEVECCDGVCVVCVVGGCVCGDCCIDGW